MLQFEDKRKIRTRWSAPIAGSRRVSTNVGHDKLGFRPEVNRASPGALGLGLEGTELKPNRSELKDRMAKAERIYLRKLSLIILVSIGSRLVLVWFKLRSIHVCFRHFFILATFTSR
jgi:hypothetical protein